MFRGCRSDAGRNIFLVVLLDVLYERAGTLAENVQLVFILDRVGVGTWAPPCSVISSTRQCCEVSVESAEARVRIVLLFERICL